jgi:protein tyrosine/serine phosphatase
MALRPFLLCALLALAAGCDSSERLRNFSAVEEGVLYRSGRLEGPALRRAIEENGLKTVVDLGGWDTDPAQWQANQEVADELGVTRYAIHMSGDGRANPNGYLAALRILADPANQPALVHCAGGTERTGAAVVLYRHLVQGELVQPAYEESLQHGHEAEDYEWIAFLADWMPSIGEAWRRGGWIEGVPPIEPKPGELIDANPASNQWIPPDYPGPRPENPEPHPLERR